MKDTIVPEVAMKVTQHDYIDLDRLYSFNQNNPLATSAPLLTADDLSGANVLDPHALEKEFDKFIGSL